jgi:hypothetical protein
MPVDDARKDDVCALGYVGLWARPNFFVLIFLVFLTLHITAARLLSL